MIVNTIISIPFRIYVGIGSVYANGCTSTVAYFGVDSEIP